MRTLKDPAFPPIGSGGHIARIYGLLSIVFHDLFSLRLNQVLTVITMAIGSMAMAATFFVGDGALKGLWADLERLMGDYVIVYPDAGPNRSLLTQRQSADLTVEDLHHVQRRLTKAKYVVPRFFGMTEVEYEGKWSRMPVDGITQQLFSEPSYRPLRGRTFSNEAAEGVICECLLDESAAQILGVDISRQPFVRMANQRCHIVGVSADPPEADPQFKARIIIPYAFAQFMWETPGVLNTIAVAWPSPDKMEETIASLRSALDEARAPGAYYLSSSQFTILKRKNIVANFMVFGMAQSIFCILVASIGVINVMLSNVVRRSREFSIRVAMGARTSHLGFIVIVESLSIAILGAAIGVLAAWAFSPFICTFLSKKIAEASALTPHIGLRGVIIPLIACSISGLVAGIIPALRVRRLNILPILRSE